MDVAWLLDEDLPSPVNGLTNIFMIVRGGSAIRQIGWQDHFLADKVYDLMHDTVSPLWAAGLNFFGDGIYHGTGGQPATVLSDLLRVVFGRARMSRQEAQDLYRSALVWLPHISSEGRTAFLRSLTVDTDIDAGTVADVLEFRTSVPDQEHEHDLEKIRCAAAHLDPVRDPDATVRLTRMIDELLPPSISEWTEVVLDAALRVSELNLSSPFRQQLSSEQAQQLVDRFGKRRPDLQSRITVLVDPHPTGSAGESESR